MTTSEENEGTHASPPPSTLHVQAALSAVFSNAVGVALGLFTNMLAPADEHEFAEQLSELARLLHEHAQHRATGTWEANGSDRGPRPPGCEPDEQGQP